MVAHDEALSVRSKKPTTDAQRGEFVLRNQFNYVKNKRDHSAEVLALLDEVESRSSQQPDLKACLGVLAWMDAHENALPM
jgi:hypothetical protein